ncbi:glycoprotein-N-acetylgalactosamine 3-beta-galactosyltransferase 1-like [Haliotis rufescens]|uniref:glycoprotein-N-acetylgalactosamine 3-beta-galactosyltransferase 1-like n=1 Tax=Haliotis rufescens TaxID=6454 RepID=UPI00201EB5FA|nr:glycoprotein-N-acetylgalactosamine 3-beta-galactosyltransferase 1-like [Haliotis rufescens]XP_048245273.1 glycoprotein-N-acetylgalactosamine 3-beta-galactosyltransferase 1-like [Haliotis rufescens]
MAFKCKVFGICLMVTVTSLAVLLSRILQTTLTSRASFGRSGVLASVRGYERQSRSMAETLRSVRLLCWVMTMPSNFKKKARYVRETWGKRCDVLLFFSSVENKALSVIGLNVSEGRSHLTDKTYHAFRYVYKHYFNQADWFLKADDDTYVIVDNLKFYLSKFDKNQGLYFGATFSRVTPQGYNSGGAGYVLSKEALKKFGERGSNNTACPFERGVEDVAMGLCMFNLGVKLVNTLDKKNKTRFHAYNPLTHMEAGDKYLNSFSAYGYRTGAMNISDLPLTFHYIQGRNMKAMEFYLYHVRHVGDGGTVLT